LGIELLLLVMLAAGRRDMIAGGLAVAGVMLVATTRDAVVLFAALELVSGCTWLILYSQRACLADTGVSAAKLATRHVLLSLVGSALLLLGLSIVCGTMGTTDLETVRYRLDNNQAGLVGAWHIMRLAVALIFAGLGIRVGVVPFALHLPHTCRLITNRGAMLLLLLPWFAGTIALIRLLATILPGLAGTCWPLAGLLAVVSMGYAGLAALGEQNIRRLAAYIIIAQSGFMLLGPAAALSQVGVSESVAVEPLACRAVDGTLFCLLAMGPSVIGALGVLVYLGREDGQIDVVDELAGLGRTRPWIAAAMALFLLSLAGMPPLAGFWARVAVLLPTVTVALTTNSPERWWFAALAIAAAASMVLTTVACAGLVVVMYFRLPLATPKTRGGRAALVAIVGCVILTILIGLGWIAHDIASC
ncbi:MAG: proton-conducting transporter membrane subunit, partial [Planctomycetota bacterium]|nr:proton-conducting transporter membrane subunit [Planctomycetota bacterium]